MEFKIITHYKPRPGSNVGKYVAKGLGRQVSVVNNFTHPDQHLRAARALAEKLGGTVTNTAPVEMSEDGQRRVFEAEVK